MTKKEFLDELRKELGFLPTEDVNDAIKFYDEYFNDAEGTEEQIINQLGSPKRVAQSFYREYNYKKYSQNNTEQDVSVQREKKKKSNIPVWLIVIIAIFAVPVIIPLIISILGVFIGIIFTIIGVIFAAICVFAALSIGGGAWILDSIINFNGVYPMLLQGGIGLFLFGIGLLLGWLLILAFVKVIPALFRGFANLFGRLFNRR